MSENIPRSGMESGVGDDALRKSDPTFPQESSPRLLGAAQYSQQELARLAETEVFALRERVMENLHASFERLQKRLAKHLRQGTYLAPDGVDYAEGKISHGEHLEGLPYAFVDLPRFFARDSLFTYRSLFWWGHGLSFSMILEGEHLPQYRRRLLENREILRALDVHVSVAGNPWDWQRGPGHTLTLDQQNEAALLKLFRAQSYLKCVRFLSFEDPEFRENRVDEVGFYTFQVLEPLILA